ncbi:MAG: pyridoxamine 5'-phosphate oxidase family protein [Bacteroidota bacterium]
MPAENNLCFIKDRIGEIRSAILYSMSNELIKIPLSIITVLRVDEDGHVWFFVKKPAQMMFDHEKSFPARLQFYRKGKPFYIHVTGYAGVSDNKETINGFTGLEKETEDIAMQDLMLIKLKMTKAEYYEQKSPSPEHFSIQSIFQNLYSSLFKPAGHYRLFELNTRIA